MIRPLPPGDFAARFLAAVIRPPRVFFMVANLLREKRCMGAGAAGDLPIYRDSGGLTIGVPRGEFGQRADLPMRGESV